MDRNGHHRLFRTVPGDELVHREPIDGCDLEVAMAEQDLNGAQVGAGFEQVRGETMSQGVRMDLPAIETGSFSRNLAGTPQDLRGHEVAGGVPAVAGEEPLLRLAPKSAPVGTQSFE